MVRPLSQATSKGLENFYILSVKEILKDTPEAKYL
jgi:hypothetical protein